ncbi:error-prone DNA polymerase [Cryptosporangium phraense]|uniref:Error-prone DNA polymerase n=1 Tax=Cryptosporangium phraense TaxID=2593070 RepID=A0A545AK65_9ACTN|nr:error-prone DNA polymerase [Cryptosporangium phraense]TQS41714.1 error-prone DNA polymerase [Cryptosporangium phraense]
MGFDNPVLPWKTLERALSGEIPDGGDAPAWSRKRETYTAKTIKPPVTTPYAELHCHSNFSFLDGASHPEELVEEAVRLGLTGLALTDHDGMYGVVRFAEAAAAHGLATVFGAELSLGLKTPQNGVPDPEGDHLLVLARDPTGYHRLCSAMSEAHLRGKEKGRPVYDLDELAEAADGHWLILTGCRKGAVRKAEDPGRALKDLMTRFGRDNVVVELTDHGDPLDSERNDAFAELAAEHKIRTVATNNVHYATPARRKLATALAAVRARRSLDEIEGWLPAAATAHLRSGAEMAQKFARYPGAVANAAALAEECSFDLTLIAPKLPDSDVGPGHTEMSWLRHLTAIGARDRYGTREEHPHAYAQIDHELEVIEKLGFPGYFLIVESITTWCKQNDILCQGRGSAANSAVCFALGITNVDAVKYGLLFERFLAPEREGPPDIDLDIESGRRELVIQHVYDKYGRRRAAQVANVISYRPKSAIRDVAKAFGFSPGQQDAWSKQLEHWGKIDDADIPEHVTEMAEQLLHFPRHLGIHSGGMVLCDRPVTEVCPVEWARMENRTVLQWDKDDCAIAGLVKFDLLGLGMLTALHHCVDMVRDFSGLTVDLHKIPLDDKAVYEMLCEADSVGVFQVESRAQMATLPRLKPREFYDLVVEVALIRPGPIQGGSVHPYIRRRNGLEKPRYAHPLLENALSKTLGVPLFQEQLMQMAVDVAGFSASESDQLRRAIGSKRSPEKMAALRDRFYRGMAANGITGELADQIFAQLAAFANFGFPESHSVSFAALVLYSSWFKRYFPAAFCAALLASQPMGFYSPQSLVADARRHGVTVRGPDLNLSVAQATLERINTVISDWPDPGAAPRLDHAVRLGLASVRTIGDDLAERLVAEREENGPFTDMTNLTQRIALTAAQVEALATAGAFDGFGLSRRAALWAAGAVAQGRPDRLAGVVVGVEAPMLPGMSEVEEAVADVWATGVSPDSYPTQFVRDVLDARGALPISFLPEMSDGTRVLVGGVVTHRQRPATAGGVTFINLEDETGMLNVVCTEGFWARYRRIARGSAALLIRGRLQNVEGVIGVTAEFVEPLPLRVASTSRNFR